MKQKCYFAYCWDDSDNIMDLMLYMKGKIEDKSKNNIYVFWDKKSSNKGENFKENEKKILKSDSVVIFFSPKYKYIIDRKVEERGVWREYELILSAWQKNQIAVMPVIVEGTVDEAMPCSSF